MGLAAAVAQGKATQQAEQDGVKKAIIDWVNYLRDKLVGYVIRRTVNSVDPQGNPISGIPPFKTVTVLLEPTEEEMETQLRLVEGLGDTKGKAVSNSDLAVSNLNIHTCFVLDKLNAHELLTPLPVCFSAFTYSNILSSGLLPWDPEGPPPPQEC